MKNKISKTKTQKRKNILKENKVFKYLIYVFYFWFFIFNISYASLPIAHDSLSCGLKVLTYQTDRLPLIEMRWVAYAGSIYDPVGKEGLANVTNRLLTHGTKVRSAVKISSDIEFVGGTLSVETNYDYATLHVRVLTKNTDLALVMLSDVLLNSIFTDSEIAKVKNEIIGNTKQRYDYPFYVGWEKFNQLLCKSHPYAHQVEGDTLSVANITRKDIIDFFNKYYTIDNSFLVIAGDFDKTAVLNKMSNLLSQMHRGKPDTQIASFESGPFAPKPQGYYIYQPQLNQSYVFIGVPGIAETSPDYFPTRVMNFILGGSPLTSRIGAGVRETQGLAYDARSFFDRRLYGGLFAATTQTSDPNKGINTILNEIKKMYKSGATLEELKNAKTFYIGNFPFNYDATRDKIDLLQNIEIYHKGLDYPEKFKSNIEKITLDEINQSAKKYLFPNNYLLVIVTNVAKDSLGLQDIDWLN